MDVAYDHITEETLAPDEHDGKGKGKGGAGSDGGLNTELTQAYKALSASPWGTRLGAFVGTVRKQGESYYEHARKESGAAAESASKGLSDLRGAIVSRTRSLSLQSPIIAPAGDSDTADTAAGQEKQKQKQKEKEEEEEGLLQKLRKGAAQRIHEIEAAEARADEYLLKFGSNIGSFLRDAVTIAPPQTADGAGADTKEVLFEAKGGEKQILCVRPPHISCHSSEQQSEEFTGEELARGSVRRWCDAGMTISDTNYFLLLSVRPASMRSCTCCIRTCRCSSRTPPVRRSLRGPRTFPSMRARNRSRRTSIATRSYAHPWRSSCLMRCSTLPSGCATTSSATNWTSRSKSGRPC